MARPSLKAQRTEEILQAYERCIALYGVDGATQQKISEEAGIARPLLRHHVGNNADLLAQVVQRYIARNKRDMQKAYDLLAGGASSTTLLGTLFGAMSSEEQQNDVMIAFALIVASQTDESIRLQMKEWLEDFIESFAQNLQKVYPQAAPRDVRAVSSGIIGIYFNIETLTPLAPDKALRTQSFQAALHLIKLLEK